MLSAPGSFVQQQVHWSQRLRHVEGAVREASRRLIGALPSNDHRSLKDIGNRTDGNAVAPPAPPQAVGPLAQRFDVVEELAV